MAESKTCKECGFLTIEGHELSRPERIMLATHGSSSVMPAYPERTRCFKNLWDYDLIYSGDNFHGVIDEIERSRDDCPGFMPYEAGFTPAQHQEIQLEQMKGRPEKDGVTKRRNKEGKEVTLEADKPTPFEHSDDFRTIVKDGKLFRLTPQQAHVIQILWDNWERGIHGVGAAFIIEQVSPDTSTKRLRDIFKGRNLEAYKALIEYVPKGIYRLKI